jgi:hypothetical protein
VSDPEGVEEFGPSNDQLLASAANYLIQGDELEAAMVLLLCTLDLNTREKIDEHRLGHAKIITVSYGFDLTGPREAYDILSNDNHRLTGLVEQALLAVVPFFDFGTTYTGMRARAQVVDIGPDWRAELLELAGGKGVHNQGVEIPNRKIVTWRNLRFRAEGEKRIAIALDMAGVLFLPNCLARLTVNNERATREADFLVCYNGKWGILEVDGPFHPRASADHERDRFFQHYRIRVTQRFDWQDCMNDAPEVVRRFLALLDKNG